ncbi:hypothetical protein [Paraglaciecola sp. L1A13]|uniref:hypothetical protein n=1 Tax=Paraglaciecola sp. L1A13 TaxID=2686359 RepID=UPI00131A9A99|nr:hypothetical protein [Paraglaciecola sp. L1A13]
MNTPNPDQARDASSDAEAVDLIKEMMGAATDAGQRYQRQFSLAKTLMGREWKLSARALLLVMTGVLLLTAVGATLWLTLNAMLALGLVQLGLHWAWVGSSILLLNGLVLWGLIATIRALLRHISFSRAWEALTLSTDVSLTTKPDHTKETTSASQH